MTTTTADIRIEYPLSMSDAVASVLVKAPLPYESYGVRITPPFGWVPPEVHPDDCDHAAGRVTIPGQPVRCSKCCPCVDCGRMRRIERDNGGY